MKWAKFILPFIFGMFISTSGYAVNCAKNPLYCKIIKLQPKIDKKWAMKLSDLIHSYAKKYKLNARRSIAIANQESGIRMINRKAKVVIVEEQCVKKNCKEVAKVTTGYTDVGIFQISAGTAKDYKIDLDRLLTDVEYNVEVHFRILKDKVKLCKHLKRDSWTCYHSKTRHLRLKYKKLVNRYY